MINSNMLFSSGDTPVVEIEQTSTAISGVHKLVMDMTLPSSAGLAKTVPSRRCCCNRRSFCA